MRVMEGQKQKRTMVRAMTKERSFVAGDYADCDLYLSSRTQERALNSAIVRAEISESFEEYLEIFEAFYADDIEVSSETAEEPIEQHLISNNNVSPLKSGGREGIRTPGLLVANSGENKLRQSATIT